MSWTAEIPEADATGAVQETYARIRAGFGMVPNFFRAQAPTPGFLAAQVAFFSSVLADGALPARIKEQIAVVVSGLNTSSYCIALHMENLRTLGIEKALGRKLAVDYPHAPVESNVLALFRLADKLTRQPADVQKADWDAAFAAGWSEAQLLEAVQVAAAMNFANRISIGLGLVSEFL
jgi:uncharacterized peroxidase-related enzyme